MQHTDGPPDATLLERCPCGCSIYRSEEEPTLFLERCLLHDSAPALLAACKLAKQHLDAMRLESGMGNVLLPFEKAAFEQVDDALTAAIAQAKGKGDQCPTE